MTVHSFVVFVHILAAVVLVGHTLFTPFVQAAVRDAPTLAALRRSLLLARDSGRASPIAALVVLATGLQLASGRWGEGWLPVALGIFVVSSVLAVGVVKATGERLGALAAAAGDGPVTKELESARRSGRWTTAVDALVANDLAMLFLMVVQPGLVASIAVTVGANAALLALRAVRDRRPGAAASGLRTAP
jgi:hypothetical protein